MIQNPINPSEVSPPEGSIPVPGTTPPPPKDPVHVTNHPVSGINNTTGSVYHGNRPIPGRQSDPCVMGGVAATKLIFPDNIEYLSLIRIPAPFVNTWRLPLCSSSWKVHSSSLECTTVFAFSTRSVASSIAATAF